MYILLSGTPPFNGANDKRIMEAVESGKYKMDIPELRKVSQSGKDLIKKMLNMDYINRISAKQCLDDTWFKEQSDEASVLEGTLSNLASFNVVLPYFSSDRSCSRSSATTFRTI